eukprot:767272-Hanusia_phi.AAC.4
MLSEARPPRLLLSPNCFSSSSRAQSSRADIFALSRGTGPTLCAVYFLVYMGGVRFVSSPSLPMIRSGTPLCGPRYESGPGGPVPGPAGDGPGVMCPRRRIGGECRGARRCLLRGGRKAARSWVLLNLYCSEAQRPGPVGY